ncbi:glycogen/starch/alpha-glucan phosphorylase [Catenisphaera adipataccumulans]|jgi:starch phosphorylase|uniref:Alpha-1,4 glucan phosphorylase n=1 Tax=Catenisphaera adipataccumulans TaxID=700500 RepID=A0A7W8CXW1_9FIRM|nr:glycogen/starch/alpha-glucan phosphorylase [Catenisphaera adipataccumulans]MBB5182419.1 starch phosphorylase [Catenisphaera adipataccumulans]
MPNTFDSKETFVEKLKETTSDMYGRDFEETNTIQRYRALGSLILEEAGVNWRITKNAVKKQQAKQLYYFSMEFLMGRLMTSNLMNLGVYDVVKDGLEDLGMDINELEELESDAGLGNGGLGRLAACFMDSLASLNYAGNGNCIRYRYGLFKQEIVNNEQVELPDCWLKYGNIWEVWKPHHNARVKFGGYVDGYMNENGKFVVHHHPDFVVRAVAYDEPIIGYHTPTTNTLRLWDAEVDEESVPSGQLNKYLQDVSALTTNVYPDDSTQEGKELRLKQEYFFVCAGIDAIITEHLRRYPSLDNFADKVAIQLNDTHPVLVIPELMRVLMDEYDYNWDDAWQIVTNTVAYTNHTVMAEALEKWPVETVKKLLPRLYMIIEEIDRRWKFDVDHRGLCAIYPNVAIIREGNVHMANLAIVGSHSVNGVAALHSKILVDDVFKDFARIYPDHFNNKTNGITHRRWLMYSNPQLTALLDDTIGTDYKTDPRQLEKLMDYVDDPVVQQRFLDVKKERKKILAKYIKDTLDIDVNIDSIFDCQAKRLHAYKRQLLNIMHVMYLYMRMKEDRNFRIYPRTFIFSAKAAPSYYEAKEIIKLINIVAQRVNNDLETKDFLRVVFIPNYSVSIAEILMNAADVSEQISTAGKEASGTGNMKYMMNGALTLGTLDGANVEIVGQVGEENAKIFGLHVEDINHLKHENAYNSREFYNQHPEVRKVVDSLHNGYWAQNPDEFRMIYNDLIMNNDEYFVLADFNAYMKAQQEVEAMYRDQSHWAKMMLINIAKSGYFSSDRTIQEYNDDIWHLTKLKY